MSKVTKDQYIKDLEYDMGTLTDMVIKLREYKKVTKQEILDRINDVIQNNNVDELNLLRHDLENEIISEELESLVDNNPDDGSWVGR